MTTDFGWCWPLIKPPGALNKKHCFLTEEAITPVEPCLLLVSKVYGRPRLAILSQSDEWSVGIKPTPGGFFIKGQHHPKSVFNLGPKVGPGLNKKPDFQEVFYSGFPLPNGKQQAAAPRGRRASRASILFFCRFPFGSGILK